MKTMKKINEINLTEADLKLIHLIRSINTGVIENIEVRNGLAVSYKTAWKAGRL